MRLGNKWCIHASSDKAGKSSEHALLYCLFCSFRNLTSMDGPMFVDGGCCTSVSGYLLVAPVLVTTVNVLSSGV